MKKSKILIITICSNGKRKGGKREYNKDLSLASLLPSHEKKILKLRAIVFDLLKSDKSKREGMPIKDLPYNQGLSKGPDFGGSASSCYMPAYERYTGRFYKEIQKDFNTNKILLRDTKHHVLIISGFYGLLTACEMIQLYSCHLPDHKEIEAVWKKDGFLTSLVAAYIRKYGIYRVIDLSAQDIYRNLINWSRIKRKCEVMHAFGNQNAGPALLPSLGAFAREHLLEKPEEELLKILPKDTFRNGYEEIKLFNTDKPPEGYPREETESDEPFEEELKRDIKQSKSGETTEQMTEATISGHPRDIPVISRDHNTIFNKKITEKKDLPKEIQSIIDSISLCNDVIEVLFGRFKAKGPKLGIFKIKLFKPKENHGHIHAKLMGKGDIGRSQEIDIRVTKGMEESAYNDLLKVLRWVM